MKSKIIDIIRQFHLTNEIKTYDEAAEQILNLFNTEDNFYRGYKIVESLQGFDVEVYDGSEWRYLFTKHDVGSCKNFIDKYLKH